ncbi:uncharacterized protein [Eurosta solidaginis]|uniref:uncharacterized protein isoform X2 n=1 Tax=Eurosta solidaginis TaxID=178769 RepID=UPI00353151D4
MVSSSARVPQRHLDGLWVITVCAITVILLSGSFVMSAFGAPAKLDAIAPPSYSPFPLEAQPALFTDALSAALNSYNDNKNGDGNSGGAGNNGFLNSQPTAIDSYGNPIETLKPIDTPDGRKVISAQGLQFEIPNYASGITEIKKPADDLLPPFIVPVKLAVIDQYTDGEIHIKKTNQNKNFIRQFENTNPITISHKRVSPPSPPLSNDPIAVAVPNDSTDGRYTTGAGSTLGTAATAITTTTVDVENAELVELKPQQWDAASQAQTVRTQNDDVSSLPSYIVELNDPDIGGPVEYKPAEDVSALKVIAWDLLPPVDQNAQVNTADNSIAQSVMTNGDSSSSAASVIPLTNSNRGKIQYTSSTTAKPGSITVRNTRTKPTTTPTTRATTTTTPRPTSTTTWRTTTTTPAPLNADDFYQLEHGDSYTLPSWLAGIDDPELDAAVTYIVPEDIHEYNTTISCDLLPPFEPYIDLNNIELPAPLDVRKDTTTTKLPRTTVASTSKSLITTSTTRRLNISTPKPNWVRAYPTAESTSTRTATTRAHSFHDRFSSNNIAQSHDPKFASPSPIQTFQTSTTTTQKPRLTSPEQHTTSFKQNLPTTITDPIPSTQGVSSQAGKFKISKSNPFLSPPNITSSPFVSVNSIKFTTTTTTTTTTPIEENPFNSATLPSWLNDFDYPDLAPGVPFIYNDDSSKSDVFNDLLPPSQLNIQSEVPTKPAFIASRPTSNSFQVSSSSSNRHDSTSASAFISTPRTFAFNNFPLKIATTAKPSNIHNPFARGPTSNNNNNEEEGVDMPPVLFNPPTATGNDVSNINSQTDNVNLNTFSHQQQPQLQSAASADRSISKFASSSSFNNNFAAPFETATPSGSADFAISTDPDFGSSTKITFTKSNEGKVLTNNVFGASSSVTTPSKQFGFSSTTTAGQTTIQKGFQQSSSNRFISSTNSFIGSPSTTNKALTPTDFPILPNAQPSTKFGVVPSATNVDAGKYTGGFGGSPGVLGNGKLGYAVQANGPKQGAVPGTTPTSKQATNPSIANRIGAAAPVGFNKFQGSFGGPPGVLVPFDNLKGV